MCPLELNLGVFGIHDAMSALWGTSQLVGVCGLSSARKYSSY